MLFWQNCSFGYHAGGWGKPPVDESGKPLYGDVFGPAVQESQVCHCSNCYQYLCYVLRYNSIFFEVVNFSKTVVSIQYCCIFVFSTEVL